MNLLEAIKNENNVAHTWNGATVYKSTNSDLLDFFSHGGALRHADGSKAIDLFSRALAEDELSALRMAFYFRDVRGGQGQRQAFRDQIKWLANIRPELVRKNLKLIPEYGRWDDLYELVGTELEADMFAVIKEQLLEDMFNAGAENPVSIMAKWLKSENASSKVTKALGMKTRKALGMSSKEYRKVLSILRKAIDVTERKISANKWSDVEYQSVPSNAMMKYRKAFYRHDEDRYESFVNKVANGEAKVNAATLYPHEIVNKAIPSYFNDLNSTEIMALDNQWNALPDYVAGTEENAIAVVDVSGSMTCGRGNARPIDVAVALGLYMAERAEGPYKDHFITFSDRPELQKVKGKNISEKVHNMARADWSMSTNLESVFDLILDAAVKNNIPQSEMLDKLYIISDMQVNCIGDHSGPFFDQMRKRYAKAGYELPLLVFWNVNAVADNQPMTIEEGGFVNVSGYSPSIFKNLMDGEIKEPVEFMMDVINSPRYEAITV